MGEDHAVEVAREYAEAYAAFDRARLAAVLAADLRFRQVNPGGFLTLGSAAEYIDASGDPIEAFAAHEALAADATRVGDRIATSSRMLLTHGSQRYLMEHREVVTVADGQVVAIDSACTGPRPLRDG